MGVWIMYDERSGNGWGGGVEGVGWMYFDEVAVGVG